jgi:hypothetical protein
VDPVQRPGGDPVGDATGADPEVAQLRARDDPVLPASERRDGPIHGG